MLRSPSSIHQSSFQVLLSLFLVILVHTCPPYFVSMALISISIQWSISHLWFLQKNPYKIDITPIHIFPDSLPLRLYSLHNVHLQTSQCHVRQQCRPTPAIRWTRSIPIITPMPGTRWSTTFVFVLSSLPIMFRYTTLFAPSSITALIIPIMVTLCHNLVRLPPISLLQRGKKQIESSFQGKWPCTALPHVVIL